RVVYTDAVAVFRRLWHNLPSARSDFAEASHISAAKASLPYPTVAVLWNL
ncbi:MAG: hypothetical protein QOC61_146, partial [Acidobacteriota bacterium]|nr:hypothetical protein [Acidobacteriota bacterium]